jgi:N-acetylglucosaminyl-diphospho-decaprenol L-rhamnosyltransferase
MEKIANPVQGLLSISVVSHLQMPLIAGLMQDIHEHCKNLNIELILTLNLDEELVFHSQDFFFPVRVIKNQRPKGFGANHNQAFQQAFGQYFCVINPDIRFGSDPFSVLLNQLKDPALGVIAPLVVGMTGALEDSVRRFPTPLIILSKVFGQGRGGDYSLAHSEIEPDWVGGMFMLFPRQVFEQLHGFDERYFLYYEDVDLCGRLLIEGYKVGVCPQVQVVHHAQRSSHRSLKYLRWHLASMLRFFLSPVYRQLKKQKR